MQRKCLRESDCPVARTLDVVGDWWTLMIVRDAFIGIRRFSDFQRSLGLAKNVLSARLAKLVEDGIFETAPASDGSAYQEYVLTEKGRSLITVIVALRQWGERHMYGDGELDNQMVDRENAEPVCELELLSADGRKLSANDVMVRKL